MIYVIVGLRRHWPQAILSNRRGNGKGDGKSMTIDQVNPKTGKVKEYQNSAEWLKDVEEFTAKPPEKKPEVKTFADAMKRYNKELGIRDPAAEKAAADADFIKKQVAEGIATALARQQVTQSQQAMPEVHSKSTNDILTEFCQKIGWMPPKCGCKSQTAQTTTHSARSTGPVMAMHAVRAGKSK